MKFSPKDIGALVRPRVLTHVFLYPHFPNGEEVPAANKLSVDVWWKSVRDHYKFLNSLQKEQLTSVYRTSLPDLFVNLKLGDTSKDLSECYVGKITSFIVIFHGSYYLIDSEEKGIEFEKRVKKAFGEHARLPVYAVGLKFYKGMTVDPETSAITAIDPWEVTDDNEKIWFFYPKHVIPIENIIRFEQIKPGNIVLFKKASGMVVSTVQYNKAAFYKICSWTGKSIKILTSSHFSKFHPDKNFQVQSKNEKDLW